MNSASARRVRGIIGVLFLAFALGMVLNMASATVLFDTPAWFDYQYTWNVVLVAGVIGAVFLVWNAVTYRKPRYARTGK